MNDHRRELAENLEKYLIDLDDTFRFHCRGCGKCCKNRRDVILTARDLFRIAREKGLQPKNIVKKYCRAYIGSDSCLPVVCVTPVGSNDACPFLNDKRCSIHKVKPAVCALYPLGRVATGKILEEGIKPDTPVYARYIFQEDRYSSLKKQHTVRGWLEQFGIPVEDEFFLRWNETLIYLSLWIRKMEQKIAKSDFEPLWNLLFNLMYLAYDTQEEFMPQFERNAKLVKEFAVKLSEEMSVK